MKRKMLDFDLFSFVLLEICNRKLGTKRTILNESIKESMIKQNETKFIRIKLKLNLLKSNVYSLNRGKQKIDFKGKIMQKMLDFKFTNLNMVLFLI